MITQVEQKITSLSINNATTQCLDLEREQTTDLQADYIFMAQVLLHIKHTEQILSTLYQCLNPKGQLIIVDFDYNEHVNSPFVHSGFKHDHLENLLKRVGFKQINSETFYHGEQIFMGQDASMFITSAQK
ncbi:Methyltransferase domain-containing protein [Amphibacillus marinus]|uniref:Methyltransferase domain-containing protein n=1 Tax=Amphibacillus marinus TaxID=872970 RepID=A0A1H8H370_9BACI|nr:methyltransferase domain-containing protein [Amphibacillus marinus]SEN49918.1 Methyltransferase domain-containing protein [Amphibacillus marinus]